MLETKVLDKIKTHTHTLYPKSKHAHILYQKTSFSENCVVYEIMWNNMVQP